MRICDVHGVPLATNTATAALCLDAALKLAVPV
jgi:methylglyoxal synthase